MEAVLAPHKPWVRTWEKSERNKSEEQHNHDLGRGYQLLQSAVYREIDMETPSGLHSQADSEVTDRAWQIPAALLLSPGHQVNSSYSWTQSYNGEGTEPLPANHTHFLQ